MANVIPEKGINFRVYLNGRDLVGVAEGTLPNLESITSEVQGAGIAGTINSPVLGHFGSLTLSLTWRSATNEIFRLAQQETHDLDLYEAMQDYEPGWGTYTARSLHVYTRVVPKSINLGKLVVGDKMDTQTEFEVLYMKVMLDGKDVLELDKLNYICRINNVDYLASVRRALGK